MPCHAMLCYVMLCHAHANRHVPASPPQTRPAATLTLGPSSQAPAKAENVAPNLVYLDDDDSNKQQYIRLRLVQLGSRSSSPPLVFVPGQLGVR
jgi:hypothetical protein